MDCFGKLPFPLVTPMTQLLGVALTGTGSCLPSRIVPNEEFAESLNLDTSDEWIRTRTGIRTRRFAGVGESSATLGDRGGRERARFRPPRAGGHRPHRLRHGHARPHVPSDRQPHPGVAWLPPHSGVRCRGGLLWLSLCPFGWFTVRPDRRGQARARSWGPKCSPARWTSPIATPVSSSATARARWCLSATNVMNTGVRSIRLYSDGSRQELIQVPSRVTPNPPPGPPQLQRLDYMRISGREVFRFAVTRMIELIQQAEIDCREMGMNGGPDFLIPHQVNQRIIDAALETAKFPSDRVMVNLDRYGNTSAASVPIALDEALRTGRCKPGDTALLVAFGGGLTWSSAIVTL